MAIERFQSSMISQREIDALMVYEFLRSEGMEIQEAVQVLVKLEKIYKDIISFNRPYSIHQISLVLVNLLEDDYFDDNFVVSMFSEAYDKTESWKEMRYKLLG